MALVKTIKDRLTHDTIYPITKADAVYLSDNVTTVEGFLGDTSIASIGDGTITGAISALNGNLKNFTYKQYSVTTGNTLYADYYYGDISIQTGLGTIVGAVIYTATSNRPAFITIIGASTVRIFTNVANTTVSFRIFYMQ